MSMHTLVPQMKRPRSGLLTGGQPAADAWPALSAGGVVAVINLRPDAEQPDRDEAAEVDAAGLDYVHLPVGGAADITPDNARVLWQALQESGGTTLVHCASGNRVGALLALGAALHGGVPREAALALGREAGLTGLEPHVRELLSDTP